MAISLFKSWPLSEETAYAIWTQLRHQMFNAPMAPAGDPLSKDERALYEMLTKRFAHDAAAVEIKSDNSSK